MDYVKLATEITIDPENIGYADMTDAEIAASLSAATIRVRQHVAIPILAERARELQISLALRAVAIDETKPVALRSICQEVLSLVDGDIDDVDLDHPTSQAMFGALLQYGIITPQQAGAIDALATARVISRAEQIGLGAAVTVEDIERSRIVPQLDALRVRLANGYNLAVEALDAAATVPEWSEIVAIIEAA